MPSSLSEPLAEHLRLQAIAALERYLDGELDLSAAIVNARKLSKCKWYREMLSQLEDYAEPSLPYAPDDKDSNVLSARAAVSRVILFLRQNRAYVDDSPAFAHQGARLYGITFLVSIVGLIATLVADAVLGSSAWMDIAFRVFAVTAAVCFFLIFAAQVYIQLVSGVHIFRVRVLRQDLRYKLDQDIWPYIDPKDYESDMGIDRKTDFE